uniref:Remorin C-terminal domain-containing protein n=2 Tax=Davidia involucrata TaxID=16924 RepID=A0A5B7BKN6_DAVIN
MLLGVEKKRKEEEELESTFSLRSPVPEIDDSGGSCSENCKDVDVVTIRTEYSTSTTADSLATEMVSDRRLKDHSLVNSRIRSQDDSSLDYDNGHDSMSVSPSVFEFQKAERALQRVALAPFSKPAPSKWDDAQKWIASPTSNRPKTGQSHGQGGQGVGLRKTSNFGYGSRQPPSMKVVVEVPDQRLVAFEEPDTKWIDSSQAKKENGGQKFISWEDDPYPIASYGKPALMIENCVGESAINLSRHDSSISVHCATTFIPPPSTARSVSMRDMGTEMTPNASQEPSRTGTPLRATTPMRSPTSSRPSTPGRAAPASSPIDPQNDHLDPNKKELSEKELQMKTRREIMALGTHLGKKNIAAWASKEEEDKDASTSLKPVGVEQLAKSVIETRAAAWEEAEKAKYMTRFQREEIKIQAWENHQKAKTEAEMSKIEVDVERMRGRADARLMNKLAAARHKAEEKRVAAEAKRNWQATKTEQQAEYIRRTGRIPSSFSCCGWCS